MNIIISLVGYSKSGKDEVAKIIQELHPQYSIQKFAAKLKEVASVLLGVPKQLFEEQWYKDMCLGVKWDHMTVRQFLQRLGPDCIRFGLHQDTWVNALFSDYKQGDSWLISDTRFINEAQYVKDAGGLIIRVNRPGITPANDHYSEVELDSWKYDYVIENDGTIEDLKNKIKAIL